jgi:peptidoglycan/xylan/chitin deacetylase (PgdA/CDA1 family)
VPRVATTPGPDISNGPRDRQQVALTFHGQGSLSLARRILKSCAEADAAITVFAVGTWLHASPTIGREIIAAGHELGNHTWSHQQMKQLSSSEATSEAVKGSEALVHAVGNRGIWFRPSGTKNSTPTIRAAARTAGYQRCVSYDVDPEDFRDPGAAAVRRRTLAAVRPGSIVSLHFGHEGTAEALPGILSGLTVAGLKPVTLSVLLADA